jgi:hypothetical protein
MLLVSVFVQYDDWGRMGNRLFQFAFGYCLAKDKGCKLYTPPLPNFNVTGSMNEAVKPVNPIHTRSYGNNHVNYDELLLTDRDIIVDSFVQKTLYYYFHQQSLKYFFNIQPIVTNKDKLVVHVRETDYIEIGKFLGYDFYRKMIDSSGFKDIIIVTDNSNCETVRRLISDGCTLNTEGYVDKFEHHSDKRGMVDFTTLLCSENIATSQSSFSWWAAFLGNHKRIIMPFTKEGGMWKLKPDRDDSDLYINLPNVEKFIL